MGWLASSARRVFAPALLALLCACSSSHHAPGEVDLPEVAPPKSGAIKIGQPYQINGVWYYPKADPSYDETGIASWYGHPFHGAATANGETYDMDGMTAAHQTLPLPTDVRVTNLENGRSVIVRVNDRGPFVNGRIIDVSRRAARLLGFYESGTAKVRVQIAGTAESGTFVAQKPVTPLEESRVAAAPVSRIVSDALPPPPGSKTETTRPVQTGPKAKPEPPLVASVGRVDAQNPEVTYVPVPKSTAIYIQIGAFKNLDNAKRLRDKVDFYGPARIANADVKGETFHRVRIGPMPNVDAADAMLNRVIGQFPGARISVE